MSKDGPERARRAREAYNQHRQEVGKQAVHSAQQAAESERQRVAHYTKVIPEATHEALERLERAGFPGISEYTLYQTKSSLFKGSYNRAITILGWEIYTSYEDNNAGSKHEAAYYLLPDETYVRSYHSRSDYYEGYSYEVLSVEQIVGDQDGLDGVILRKITSLGR